MHSVGQSRQRSSIRPRLLYRWYASLDSLALLSPGSTGTEEYRPNDVTEEPEDAYVDDYNGYATDLSQLLGKIGQAISAQRESRLHPIGSSTSEIDSFEAAVYGIMERDNSATPLFYPGVREKLEPQAVQEYAWCNQAYQHTALIYIRRHLRKLSSHTPAIQESVKTIIDCVRAIKPAYGLSPTIVLTTPLFVAGCEAQGQDRTAIKELLTQLHDSLNIRNIKLTLDILENHWADCSPDEDVEAMLRQYYSQLCTRGS